MKVEPSGIHMETLRREILFPRKSAPAVAFPQAKWVGVGVWARPLGWANTAGGPDARLSPVRLGPSLSHLGNAPEQRGAGDAGGHVMPFFGVEKFLAW